VKLFLGHDKSGLPIRRASFEASLREAPQDQDEGSGLDGILYSPHGGEVRAQRASNHALR
jgi:hypothetical protein